MTTFLLHGKRSISLPFSLKCSSGEDDARSTKGWEAETEGLTTLCQKQVNFWNTQNPLSNDQIDSVKKIAKLAILHRSKSNLDFVNVLSKGIFECEFGITEEKCFDPDLLYLTAQTMFRGPP